MKKSADSMLQTAKNVKDPAKSLRESVMRELSLTDEPEASAQPQPEPRIAPPGSEKSTGTEPSGQGNTPAPAASQGDSAPTSRPLETQG
jgi:hypothetical protein